MMSEKIYSKPASKEYIDNYEKVFGKKEEVVEEKKEEEETYVERLRRLRDIGDRLFETKPQTEEEKKAIMSDLLADQAAKDGLIDSKPQTTEEVVAALRKMSKIKTDHITPSNKVAYKPEVKEMNIFERLWNVVVTILNH